MAQINLLKQKSESNIGQKIPIYASRILMAVLFAFVAYYAWLFVHLNNVQDKTVATQKEISDTKQQALTLKGRNELLFRQKQLTEFDKILSSHLYYSQIYKSIADYMLKTATVTAIRTGGQNEVVMTVEVPSLEDLDKFLQIFDNPKFNENFTSVRVGAFGKIKEDEKTSFRFDLRMKFNPQLIKLKP
jgi:hypothetical protein